MNSKSELNPTLEEQQQEGSLDRKPIDGAGDEYKPKQVRSNEPREQDYFDKYREENDKAWKEAKEVQKHLWGEFDFKKRVKVYLEEFRELSDGELAEGGLLPPGDPLGWDLDPANWEALCQAREERFGSRRV